MKQFLFIGSILPVLLMPIRCLGQKILPGDTPIVISDGSVVIRFPGGSLKGQNTITAPWPSESPCWKVIAFNKRRSGGAPIEPAATYDNLCGGEVVKISLSMAMLTGAGRPVWRAAGNTQTIAVNRDKYGAWIYTAAFGKLASAGGSFHDQGPLDRLVRIASVWVDYSDSRPTRRTTLDTGNSVICVCASKGCPQTVDFRDCLSSSGRAAPAAPKNQN